MSEPQQQQANRYAHLVHSVASLEQASGGKVVQTVARPAPAQVQVSNHQNHDQKNANQSNNNDNNNNCRAPTLRDQHQQRPNYNYYASFSNVDWREQWLMFKERTLEKVEQPDCQRKLIMLIVCTALLLDNMLYMVIVPIIPNYLRSIGSWTTYTENAEWVRANQTAQGRRAKWEPVGGQTVYEGEDSGVGFLFASKAIVQLIANPFSGAIADRIGYEIPMMFGLIVMFLSTMVFACGQTYSVLFLARSLQGVGSAFADTPGIALLADRFSEETERRRAQGIAIAFISFGCLVAPPFGSVLYEGAGKEVPFILLSLVCLIDGSLLLLVTPPGTFSALWPGSSGAGAGAAKNLQSPTSKPTTIRLPDVEQQSLEESKIQDQNNKRQALRRQKSISRRHSLTISAGGEAPKGTSIERLLRDPCIACCAGALVVANISLAFLEPTISIWVRTSMPDTEEWQEGLIWLPAFFPHVLGVFATLHLAEKWPQSTWKIAAGGLVIEGLGCLMVPFCSTLWSLVLPICVICFGVALIDTAILPTLGYLVDTRFTSVYGNVYAIADISYSLSYAIGPIIAGGIVEAIGFTALNLLIAIITLAYTPSLMMLRTIRDYEPFEQDQTGRQAQHERPFGQFGRKPLDQVGEEEEQEERSESDHQQQRQICSAKYESPGWAAAESHRAPQSGALKKAPSSGTHTSPSGGPTKSVTIVETKGNPFLQHSEQQQQQQQPAHNAAPSAPDH